MAAVLALTRPTAIPVVLGVATALVQVAYPRVAGAARDELTVLIVLLFFAASVGHAVVWRGGRFAALLVAVTAGGGLLVESVGVNTGLPFGAYRYGDALGWKLLGVPVVIPLAWTMMAYPALLVGRRIDRGRRGALIAGAALAAWDLFLDPQMVAAGHWVWAGGGPALLGIPVSNFLAWLVTAVAMMAVLWPFVPDRADDRLPYALYLWTYASSVVAHAAYLDLPGSALLGGLGMGAVVVAFLGAVRR